jgi:hypothetical protein
VVLVPPLTSANLPANMNPLDAGATSMKSASPFANETPSATITGVTSIG